MWPKIKPYILILPALLTTITLFLGGIFGGIIRSLSAGKPGEISFYAYAQIFSSQDFWASFLFTLRYAALSVLIASFLGLAIVFGLFYVRMEINSRLSLFLQRLLQLPMLFPFLVAAYIIFILLSPHGWLARLLFKLNLAGENSFPLLVNDPFGWGIIIAYVFKTCPFIILMLYPVILKIPKAWLEAGKVLGISQAGFFRKAVFPLLIPPLKTASFIVFAYTFLAFEIPYILGITYPKAIAVYAYQLYTSGSLSDRPLALAIIITSLLLIAMISCLVHIITRRWGKTIKPGGKENGFQTV
ncbi:putative spermidine/putrescine transport system permease protein [Thermosyntropha lipolytica DSM 11003]|uniref:Putative spermidine/putrescine transport system permease protein n=1 Tax=Thermosyntropha lipolytica DSM 11003 TaxID=1123382 RepID=A0A1M5MFD2_9FIRM|nr:ABC transporter permease subunit [Thermosyntropha lipolytica]SHG75882.1 putative spermidine/putrescine transport system permease protein [Thermosyntropha lipolytica DSM 11003]